MKPGAGSLKRSIKLVNLFPDSSNKREKKRKREDSNKIRNKGEK